MAEWQAIKDPQERHKILCDHMPPDWKYWPVISRCEPIHRPRGVCYLAKPEDQHTSQSQVSIYFAVNLDAFAVVLDVLYEERQIAFLQYFCHLETPDQFPDKNDPIWKKLDSLAFHAQNRMLFREIVDKILPKAETLVDELKFTFGEHENGTQGWPGDERLTKLFAKYGKASGYEGAFTYLQECRWVYTRGDELEFFLPGEPRRDLSIELTMFPHGLLENYGPVGVYGNSGTYQNFGWENGGIIGDPTYARIFTFLETQYQANKV